MVKTSLILIVFLYFLFSCKDHSCVCRYGNPETKMYYRSEVVATYSKTSKLTASNKCEAERYAYWEKYYPQVSPGDSLIQCSIE